MADKRNVEVGQLAARMLAIDLPMGLTLDEVIIQGEDVQFKSKPFQISMPKPGSLEVRISESSLAEFLNHKAPGGLSAFKVRLEDGFIYVDAKASLIISVNVGAICKIRIEDETKLIVELVRMESIGGTGAHNMVQRQLDGINPVLDTKDMPFDATLSKIEIANHWLAVYGAISPRSE